MRRRYRDIAPTGLVSLSSPRLGSAEGTPPDKLLHFQPAIGSNPGSLSLGSLPGSWRSWYKNCFLIPAVEEPVLSKSTGWWKR
jgi:hypothetical protein